MTSSNNKNDNLPVLTAQDCGIYPSSAEALRNISGKNYRLPFDYSFTIDPYLGSPTTSSCYSSGSSSSSSRSSTIYGGSENSGHSISRCVTDETPILCTKCAGVLSKFSLRDRSSPGSSSSSSNSNDWSCPFCGHVNQCILLHNSASASMMSNSTMFTSSPPSSSSSSFSGGGGGPLRVDHKIYKESTAVESSSSSSSSSFAPSAMSGPVSAVPFESTLYTFFLDATVCNDESVLSLLFDALCMLPCAESKLSIVVFDQVLSIARLNDATSNSGCSGCSSGTIAWDVLPSIPSSSSNGVSSSNMISHMVRRNMYCTTAAAARSCFDMIKGTIIGMHSPPESTSRFHRMKDGFRITHSSTTNNGGGGGMNGSSSSTNNNYAQCPVDMMVALGTALTQQTPGVDSSRLLFITQRSLHLRFRDISTTATTTNIGESGGSNGSSSISSHSMCLPAAMEPGLVGAVGAGTGDRFGPSNSSNSLFKAVVGGVVGGSGETASNNIQKQQQYTVKAGGVAGYYHLGRDALKMGCWIDVFYASVRPGNLDRLDALCTASGGRLVWAEESFAEVALRDSLLHSISGSGSAAGSSHEGSAVLSAAEPFDANHCVPPEHASLPHPSFPPPPSHPPPTLAPALAPAIATSVDNPPKHMYAPPPGPPPSVSKYTKPVPENLKKLKTTSFSLCGSEMPTIEVRTCGKLSVEKILGPVCSFRDLQYFRSGEASVLSQDHTSGSGVEFDDNSVSKLLINPAHVLHTLDMQPSQENSEQKLKNVCKEMETYNNKHTTACVLNSRRATTERGGFSVLFRTNFVDSSFPSSQQRGAIQREVGNIYRGTGRGSSIIGSVGKPSNDGHNAKGSSGNSNYNGSSGKDIGYVQVVMKYKVREYTEERHPHCNGPRGYGSGEGRRTSGGDHCSSSSSSSSSAVDSDNSRYEGDGQHGDNDDDAAAVGANNAHVGYFTTYKHTSTTTITKVWTIGVDITEQLGTYWAGVRPDNWAHVCGSTLVSVYHRQLLSVFAGSRRNQLIKEDDEDAVGAAAAGIMQNGDDDDDDAKDGGAISDAEFMKVFPENDGTASTIGNNDRGGGGGGGGLFSWFSASSSSSNSSNSSATATVNIGSAGGGGGGGGSTIAEGRYVHTAVRQKAERRIDVLVKALASLLETNKRNSTSTSTNSPATAAVMGASPATVTSSSSRSSPVVVAMNSTQNWALLLVLRRLFNLREGPLLDGPCVQPYQSYLLRSLFLSTTPCSASFLDESCNVSSYDSSTSNSNNNSDDDYYYKQWVSAQYQKQLQGMCLLSPHMRVLSVPLYVKQELLKKQQQQAEQQAEQQHGGGSGSGSGSASSSVSSSSSSVAALSAFDLASRAVPSSSTSLLVDSVVLLDCGSVIIVRPGVHSNPSALSQAYSPALAEAAVKQLNRVVDTADSRAHGSGMLALSSSSSSSSSSSMAATASLTMFDLAVCAARSMARRRHPASKVVPLLPRARKVLPQQNRNQNQQDERESSERTGFGIPSTASNTTSTTSTSSNATTAGPSALDRVLFSRLSPDHMMGKQRLKDLLLTSSSSSKSGSTTATSATSSTNTSGSSSSGSSSKLQEQDIEELIRCSPYTDQLYYEKYMRCLLSFSSSSSSSSSSSTTALTALSSFEPPAYDAVPSATPLCRDFSPSPSHYPHSSVPVVSSSFPVPAHQSTNCTSPAVGSSRSTPAATPREVSIFNGVVSSPTIFNRAGGGGGDVSKGRDHHPHHNNNDNHGDHSEEEVENEKDQRDGTAVSASNSTSTSSGAAIVDMVGMMSQFSSAISRTVAPIPGSNNASGSKYYDDNDNDNDDEHYV